MHETNGPPPSPQGTEEQGWHLPEDSCRGESSPSNRARCPSSEALEETSSDVAAILPPLPQREEPTLKEKLVERERQARVETERARLMRQFAISINGEDAVAEEEENMLPEEHGSVTGTLGEVSSVAAAPSVDHEEQTQEETQQQLGYVMERFLQQHGEVDEPQEGKDEEKPKTEPTGVVMERFLAEPMVVEQPEESKGKTDEGENGSEVEVEAVLAEAEVAPETMPGEADDIIGPPLPSLMDGNVAVGSNDESELETRGASMRFYSTVTNPSLAPVGVLDMDIPPGSPNVLAAGSVDDILREPDVTSHHQHSSEHSTQPSEEPRVFRLTEAEIQEMAAIEEASIGNAPPSERDDTFSESSLVGDLVGEFVNARGIDRGGDFSERTNTTALESASITSVGGDLSEGPSSLETDHETVDVIESESSSSHLVVYPGASDDGSVSVTVCPPSVTAGEEPSMMIDPDDDAVDLRQYGGEEEPELRDPDTPPIIDCAPSFQDSGGPLDLEAAAAANVGVTNRAPARIAPPMPRAPREVKATTGLTASNQARIMLENFEYDKNLLATPNSRGMDSFNDLPGDDPWTPPCAMNLSPLRPVLTASSADEVAASALEYPDLRPGGSERVNEEVGRSAPTYGSTELLSRRLPPAHDIFPTDRAGFIWQGSTRIASSESQPLIRDGELELSRGEQALEDCEASPDISHLLSNVFSSMRSDSTATVEAVNTDSEKYLATGVLTRAFPERFFALLVTLLVEIPVLLMISGGSDRLCMLIGRRRYQLMMGFLPLSSAISGNVGLQASTLTTRAVSHDHVTKSSYIIWLAKEVGAAACLGLGMGCVLGSYGYIVSGMDYSFGLTIFMAQFVSIITAGLTGTLAPLIFTFIFHRDSALYGGPLETAIQDIVGSFAMVVLSYRLLVFLGPHDIDPDDICGQQGSE